MSDSKEPIYAQTGFCPVCEVKVRFMAAHKWYRDHLVCSGCQSIPRERALALLLSRLFPDWRKMTIHESSPMARGVSVKLLKECPNYIASQFFPEEESGEIVQGFRNENLMAQSFDNAYFDLVVTQDVMEHVNDPKIVTQEIARTLKVGGAHIFTAPTYKKNVKSERRALYNEDGSITHISEPEYHGNPVDDAGSLVTFHYGYDLYELMHEWAGMDVEVTRFHDHHHGIIGEFTEVYVATKRTDL